MTDNEVRNKLSTYFQNNILYKQSIDEFDKDESLVNNGHIDSIGLIGLVLYLEKTFGIKVHKYEIIPKNFDTLNNILTYLGGKVESISADLL